MSGTIKTINFKLIISAMQDLWVTSTRLDQIWWTTMIASQVLSTTKELFTSHLVKLTSLYASYMAGYTRKL